MDLIIRAARDPELDAVGELTAQVYLGDNLLDSGEQDPYLTQLRRARHRAEHAEVLVAADGAADTSGTGGAGSTGGAVLGAVTFVGNGGAYAEVSRPGEGEFRMLVVHPDARGRGVGEALVRACLTRARSRGLARVVISSQQSMRTAHRLYERLGFVRTPERDWQPVPDVGLWTFAVELR